MLAKSYCKLGGQSHDQKYFRFHESATIDFDSIHQILRGKLLGTIIHNAIPSKDREIVAQNFWNSEVAKQRNDGVPAITIGAYHYKKTLNEYFDQVEQFKPHVDKLFHGANHFVNSFINSLTIYFSKKNIHFRLAKHNERYASRFVLRTCNSMSDFIILPHDDVAQCRTHNQKDFEITKIPNHEMVAVNMCLENFNDGELVMWNIQPNDATRKKLNIEETGYPYPAYLADDYEKITIPIQVGDIYCFNGRNIHAVYSKLKTERFRTTITFFMGFIDNQTIIYWT